MSDKVTATITQSDKAMPESWGGRDGYAWRVTLKYQRRQMSVDFYTGSGWTLEDGSPKVPTAADVLECLISDFDVSQYSDFEEWAEALGYDPDSRRAEKIYRAVKVQSRKLSALLGGLLDYVEGGPDDLAHHLTEGTIEQLGTVAADV